MRAVSLIGWRLGYTGLLLMFLGCNPPPEECEGRQLTVSYEALNFGDLALDGPRDVDGDRAVPERRTLFVNSTCGDGLQITSACLLNAGHDGDPGSPAFFLEFEPGQEAPVGIRPGKDAALRITYDVGSINADLTGDGIPNQDRAILVVFSNASTGPVAIPICARAVDNPDYPTEPCELPPEFDLASVSESSCGD